MACFHLSSTDLSFKPEPAGASRSSPMMAFQELMQKKFLMGGRYAQAQTITTTTTTTSQQQLQPRRHPHPRPRRPR